MIRPRLLDLYCGGGGASVGYDRAGFAVTGVDIAPSPRYPFHVIAADALTYTAEHGREYDTIAASPPCQRYVALAAKDGRWPDLIRPTREVLAATGCPYVIENVVGAPLLGPALLCGSMFGLNVRRHRLFETNWPLFTPPCAHALQGEIRAYYGKRGWRAWRSRSNRVQAYGRKQLLRGSVEQAPADMGIDWMNWDELREAIPPTYTEFVGIQLLRWIGAP